MASPANAWTLDDYLNSLFMSHKTDTDEFKTMLRIYGRERIEKAYRDYQSRKPLPDRFSRYHPVEKDD